MIFCFYFASYFLCPSCFSCMCWACAVAPLHHSGSTLGPHWVHTGLFHRHKRREMYYRDVCSFAAFFCSSPRMTSWRDMEESSTFSNSCTRTERGGGGGEGERESVCSVVERGKSGSNFLYNNTMRLTPFYKLSFLLSSFLLSSLDMRSSCA